MSENLQEQRVATLPPIVDQDEIDQASEQQHEFRNYVFMIAKVCYTAVRAHYYAVGNSNMMSWENAPENVRRSAFNRALYFIKNKDKKTHPDDNSLEKEKVSRIFKAMIKAFIS